MSDPILVPLQGHHIDLLQWFGGWTPEVHRADWDRRKQWPPGWRAIETNSRDRAKDSKARLMLPPSLKHAHGGVGYLLQYGLIEGSYHQVWRLTMRGRCALKLAGRPVPEQFESHCPEIFDPVSLLPICDPRHVDISDPHDDLYGHKYHAPLPDNVGTWARLLAEYNETDYRSRGTLTRAAVTLTSPTGQAYLNGSLREHHRWLSLEVNNNQGQRVCEVALSLESFMDMMTSMSRCPATLSYYIGNDGMARAEPCPPPVSVMRRMKERLARTTSVQDKRLNELREAIEVARLGKRAKAELLHQLDIIQGNTPSDIAFAAQQAVEEVSSAVESLMSIASERVQIHGAGPAALLGQRPASIQGLLGMEEGKPE